LHKCQILTILVSNMHYAIVDIETTGGHASAAGITEIAIIITDGEKIIEQFATLINPLQKIPYYITKLTGINDAMVATAPTFEVIASKVYGLLNQTIFVAHNVNFDYSFINFQLKQNGLQLNCKKLCTVRYGRKVVPGLRSYSLGNFCKEMGIFIENRHRATGDCIATFYLLKKLLAQDKSDALATLLKSKTKEQNLPLQVDKINYQNLPTAIGVYYFLDKKEKIIYIGKALNIKKRVASHFAGNVITKQRQEFIRNIAYIKYRLVATELMSLILESTEIKKYWPKYNQSQKKYEHQFALYSYADQNGYTRLCVDKRKNHLPFIVTVPNKVAGLLLLRKMVTEFSLCAKFCQVPYLLENIEACTCQDACTGILSAALYNQQVLAAIASIQAVTDSFFIVDKGLVEKENSIIAVKRGNFVGMGYIPNAVVPDSFTNVENYLELYKENNFINSLVHQFAAKQNHLVIKVA
jgi:DNA polymerase III subunit epsilon